MLVVTTPHSPRDTEVDLDGRPDPRAADHGALATAVQQSLTETAPLTPLQLAGLINAAGERARKRRLRRRIGASAVAMCGAAAALTVAVVSPGALLGQLSGTEGPAAQKVAAQQEEVDSMQLTPENVGAVFPSARFAGALGAPEGALEVPTDACGSNRLAGVEAPTASTTNVWTSPDARSGATQPGGDEEVVLRSEVLTFASPADAGAYADALQRSIYTCYVPEGRQAPVFPYLFQMKPTPALYVSGYENGVADVTVVTIDGSDAFAVRAWIPVGSAPVSGAADSVSTGTGPVAGADPAGLDAAITAVIGLAESYTGRSSLQ